MRQLVPQHLQVEREILNLTFRLKSSEAPKVFIAADDPPLVRKLQAVDQPASLTLLLAFLLERLGFLPAQCVSSR